MHADTPPTPDRTLPHGALALPDWGLIRAHGDDAAAFLHGQLTQDIEHLEPGRATLAGYCSAKGRLLATFVVWRVAPDELLLACSADLLPATLKRLSMFVLRAKCKLGDAGAALPLAGVCGGDAARALGIDLAAPVGAATAAGTATALRLPDAVLDGQATPRWLLAGSADLAAAPPLAPEAWRAGEVLAGVPRVVAATAEHFVPQMVNLELVGGVNFRKGCYPGQEVVARSQYRGTLKRRAFVAQGDAPMAPGQELFDPADPGQPAGEVVLAGALPGGAQLALVEAKIAAAEAGLLHLGAATGPAVALRPPPYPLAEPA